MKGRRKSTGLTISRVKTQRQGSNKRGSIVGQRVLFISGAAIHAVPLTYVTRDTNNHLKHAPAKTFQKHVQNNILEMKIFYRDESFYRWILPTKLQKVLCRCEVSV